MNYYSQVRQYFIKEIAKIDSDLKQWTGALVFDSAENIPSTLLENRYHIEISGWTSSPPQDDSVQDRVSVKLTVFKKGFDEPTEALDYLLDQSLHIKQQLINPLNVEAFKISNDSAIEAVENSGGEASALTESNDNIVKVALEFSVRLYFCAVS